ncbi:MAG: hypothetical protein HY403_11315 [Elusimicrobia bacterium]|nr:hypothetical protein [Elusimicrobiota bacterium]
MSDAKHRSKPGRAAFLGAALCAALCAAAPGAAASGLPEFDLDLERFLRRAAAGTPVGAPAGAESPSFLKRAEELYRGLRRAGHLKAEAVFLPNTDPKMPGAPAYVVYDFTKDVCSVYIGERGMRRHGFQEDFLFRFVIYHELAHCHFYANPRELRPFPTLGDRANRMVSDLVYLEFLQMSGDDARVNGYGTYHETYADVKAAAILAAEGWPRARLQEIARFRENAPFSFHDTHDNAGVFEKVLSVPWKSFDPERLDAEARAIADPYIVGNFLRKVYKPAVWDFLTLSQILVGSLKTPYADLRSPGIPEDVRSEALRQYTQAGASQNPVWRKYAWLIRAVRARPRDERIIEAFFESRYGAGSRALGAEDQAVRRMIQATNP